MGELYNKELKGNARSLRKNMTKEERHLPNNAVKENFAGVCEEIWNRIKPSPWGEGAPVRKLGRMWGNGSFGFALNLR